MNKDKLIPELRFPEFLNTEDWNEVEFGELLSLLSDYTANGSFASLKENVQYYTSEEYAVLVRTTDLEKKEFTPARFTDKRGYDFLSKTSLFGGEIIMANVGSIGKVYKAPFYDKPMTLAPNTYVLKFKKGVDEEFIYQLMLRTEFEQKLLSMVGSSTLKAINKKNLRSIEIAIPKSNEQQKIASCLSSLDELIAAHKDKLDALKDHKKGLLQNLFPQEGETVPKVRFPEFEDDGEWELKNVEEFFNVGSSKRVLQKDWTNEGVPFYRTRELVSLSKNEPFGSEIYISEELYEELKTQYGVPTEGDFLVSGVGTLGISYQVKTDDKFYFKDGNVLWFKLEGDLVSSYFKYCFESEHIQKQIVGQTSKSTVGTYTITNAKKTEFWYTDNPQEQQKIASCLSAVDELITAQQEKIEQLQQHKKGLMQGLFPKIES